MDIAELKEKHPDIYSQVEAAARVGMISTDASVSAIADATKGMISKADHDSAILAAGDLEKSKITADATAGERSRILAVSAACQANQAGAMFARLVEDGCDEQQANGRILDALAMRNADNDVSSLHGGGDKKVSAKVDYAGALANVK